MFERMKKQADGQKVVISRKALIYWLAILNIGLGAALVVLVFFPSRAAACSALVLISLLIGVELLNLAHKGRLGGGTSEQSGPKAG